MGNIDIAAPLQPVTRAAAKPMSAEQKLVAGIGWFKREFAAPIAVTAEGTPFHLDFLAALAIQETFEVWGRAFQTMPTARILEICVGDILDASGGRDPKAFPQSRAVLERAAQGPQMFKIARQAFEDMAEVATEYKKYLKNPNKFCHAFGIFQYDIQAYIHDQDYFLNKDWHDFSKCLQKCLLELQVAWGKTYPKKKTLGDKELVYVAIAYNKGRADTSKGFKQGYKAKGETKYYGEYIWDYMTLSKKTPPAPR
ncbi:MAG: hypothetical protein ACRC1G_16375 [Bradyrhizobium sp.]